LIGPLHRARRRWVNWGAKGQKPDFRRAADRSCAVCQFGKRSGVRVRVKCLCKGFGVQLVANKICFQTINGKG
jgi:hypothetical protein